jgi:hypothetical protein
MTRADAAPIVAWLVERYKDTQADAPPGKPFQELHDLETLDPIPEWDKIYQEVIEQVNQEFNLGLTK